MDVMHAQAGNWDRERHEEQWMGKDDKLVT